MFRVLYPDPDLSCPRPASPAAGPAAAATILWFQVPPFEPESSGSATCSIVVRSRCSLHSDGFAGSKRWPVLEPPTADTISALSAQYRHTNEEVACKIDSNTWWEQIGRQMEEYLLKLTEGKLASEPRLN